MVAGLIQLGLFCALCAFLGVLTVKLGRKSEAANRRLNERKKVVVHERKTYEVLGKPVHQDHWLLVNKNDADTRAANEANKQILSDREWHLRDFRAYQECPNCFKSGFWLINWCGQDETTRFIKRECGNCGHIWNQAR
jgi:hypothetical protein